MGKSRFRQTGINAKSIRDAAKGIQKHAGGFCWRYKESVVGYLHGSEGVIPYTMPPRLEEGTPPQVPAYVTVYVLNPNSQHKEEAILYLEYLAEHRFSWDDALMKPHTAKPVLTEWAQERLLKFEKEYDADPEYLNMQRKHIEDDPENWEVLAENLAFYRNHIAPYIVIADIRSISKPCHIRKLCDIKGLMRWEIFSISYAIHSRIFVMKYTAERMPSMI